LRQRWKSRRLSQTANLWLTRREPRGHSAPRPTASGASPTGPSPLGLAAGELTHSRSAARGWSGSPLQSASPVLEVEDAWLSADGRDARRDGGSADGYRGAPRHPREQIGWRLRPTSRFFPRGLLGRGLVRRRPASGGSRGCAPARACW
jgi:hypothetical protein